MHQTEKRKKEKPMVERYDFTRIKNNKDRTRIIDEFCEIITSGNYSAAETMAIRKELVGDYLAQSCSLDKSCSLEETNEQ